MSSKTLYYSIIGVRLSFLWLCGCFGVVVAAVVVAMILLMLLSLHNIATAERSLSGLVFNINTVKLYPSLSDTQHGDE